MGSSSSVVTSKKPTPKASASPIPTESRNAQSSAPAPGSQAANASQAPATQQPGSQAPSSQAAQASQNPAPSSQAAKAARKQQSNTDDIRDTYELGELLGSGSFGQVLEVRLKDFPDKVRACKVVEWDEENEAEAAQDGWSVSGLFRKEVDLLQTFKHPNIVRFWDFYVDKHFLYVVMDLCRGGEIFDMVLALKRFTEADAAVLGAQMLAAIDYIHKMQIMHRDIKAENFLLAEKSPTSTVKMIDFGMAAKFHAGEWFHDLCGSPHYLAPELIGQKYNHKVDIWAFGVLMYLMLYGHYPFDADCTKAIMVKIVKGKIRWVTKVRLSDITVRFLERILNPKHKERITAETALQDEWILAACSPDEELGRELSEQNLTEVVRSAQKKLSSFRKQVDPRVAKSRSEKLHQIAQDFAKGIRHGERLGVTPNEEFMSKPEFVRRKNQLVSAPGAQIRETVKSIAALAHTKMQAMRKGTGSVEKSPSTKLKFSNVMHAEDKPSQTSQALSSSDPFVPDSSIAPPANSLRVPGQRHVSQTTSMRGGLMYIGDLQPEEIQIFKNTWEEWRQQSDLKNAKSGLNEPMDNPREQRQRVSTEECVLAVQAEMERAVAKRNLDNGDMMPKRPSVVKETPERGDVVPEDFSLRMVLPNRPSEGDSASCPPGRPAGGDASSGTGLSSASRCI